MKKIVKGKVCSCVANPLFVALVALVVAVVALVCAFCKCSATKMEKVLLSNPEVVIKAMQAYEQQERERAQAKAREAIEASLDEINNNPNSPVIGNPDGKIVLVEFFDFSCGFCHRLYPALKNIIEKNPDVKVVAKELTFLGSNSLYAAKAALAANEQGKYAPVYDALMDHKGALSPEKVDELAEKAGVDLKKLKADMESAKIAEILRETSQLAQKINVNGVPTLILNGQVLQTIDEGVIQNAINALK